MNFNVPCLFVTFYSYIALFDNVIMVKTKFLDDFYQNSRNINGIYHRENQPSWPFLFAPSPYVFNNTKSIEFFDNFIFLFYST